MSKWIQKTGLKRGALSRQLGIPEEKNIPKSLLERIRKAEIGRTVKNPTNLGKKEVKVTHKLKKRAVMALTLKELAERKKKRRK